MVSPSSHRPARDVYFGAMEDAHPRSALGMFSACISAKPAVIPRFELLRRSGSRARSGNLEPRFIPPRERLIVRRCFAIGVPGPATLEEVGEVLHLTRERVRQIEKDALGRLAQEALRLGLDALLAG